MGATPNRILVVDDEPDMLRYLSTLLEANSYSVETASSGSEALRVAGRHPAPDLVLLDTAMPEMNGLETLEKLNQVRPGIRIVMLSCVTDPRTVIQAMRLGAQDYLPKPFLKEELESVIQRNLSVDFNTGQHQPSDVVVEDLGEQQMTFIAAGESMHRIRRQVNVLAAVDVPILLLGESGTGKGILAKLIHHLSPRAERPFLKINCAALPSELLESELFGYEPGAFTGAVRPKPGKFEICDKGTILLDEIGEMSPGLQAKLLHVLQDKEFSRLGGRSVVKVDVRIIAATNLDVLKALASKRLREDLYYRLNAFTIKIPPLRERKETIPLLFRYFMSRFSAEYGREPLPLLPVMLDAASRYHWPGNIRELENFVKRYLILGDGHELLEDLTSKAEHTETHRPNGGTSLPDPRSNDLKSIVRDLKGGAEIETISRVLEETRWNRKKAAQMLHISYKALLYKIRRYGLERGR